MQLFSLVCHVLRISVCHSPEWFDNFLIKSIGSRDSLLVSLYSTISFSPITCCYVRLINHHPRVSNSRIRDRGNTVLTIMSKHGEIFRDILIAHLSPRYSLHVVRTSLRQKFFPHSMNNKSLVNNMYRQWEAHYETLSSWKSCRSAKPCSIGVTKSIQHHAIQNILRLRSVETLCDSEEVNTFSFFLCLSDSRALVRVKSG